MNKLLLLAGLVFTSFAGCASDEEQQEPIQFYPSTSAVAEAILVANPDLDLHKPNVFVIKNDNHDVAQVLEGIVEDFPQTQSELCAALPAEGTFACDADSLRAEIPQGACASWVFELELDVKLYVGGCN